MRPEPKDLLPYLAFALSLATFLSLHKKKKLRNIIAGALLVAGLVILAWQVLSGNQSTVTPGTTAATTHGNNSPAVSVGGNVSGQAQVAGTINNFNTTNYFVAGGERIPGSLDELERKYPLGFMLFRPDGSTFRTLQTFPNEERIIPNWDGAKITKVGERLRVEFPVMKLVATNGESHNIRMWAKNNTVENKRGATLDLGGGMRVETPEYKVVGNTVIVEPFDPFGKDADKVFYGLTFEVLDDHPKRPIYALGVTAFTSRQSWPAIFGPPK